MLGQSLHLDQIEHSLIREPGVFDEPRTHFAANCASVDSPALHTLDLLSMRQNSALGSQKNLLCVIH